MSEQKVFAFVQARMDSTRFPSKVLVNIVDKPMLWHVVHRVGKAKTVGGVVVLTSTVKSDDAIVKFCDEHRIPHFRGSLHDVLDRYYNAAKHFHAKSILRITADSPLVDPEVIDKVAQKFLSGGFDYVSNTDRYTFPDGLDVEVFSMDALTRAWKEAHDSSDREHVTPFLRTSGKFKICNVENENDLSHRQLRWTVDEPADLEFIRRVYKDLYTPGQPQVFNMADVLDLLKKKPELEEINKGLVRNEGFYLSIAKEKPVAEGNNVRRIKFDDETPVKGEPGEMAMVLELGQQLRDGYNTFATFFGLDDQTECTGPYERTVVFFKNEKMKHLFESECTKRGVVFLGVHHVQPYHSHSDIHFTLRVYRTALEIISKEFKKR